MTLFEKILRAIYIILFFKFQVLSILCDEAVMGSKNVV